MTEDVGTYGLWVLDDEVMRQALEAAAGGMSVDLILLSLYANSDVRTVGEEEP